MLDGFHTAELLTPCSFDLFNVRMGAVPQRDVAIYVRNAKKSIVIETAARAWALGVPWAEALKLSEEAMHKAGSGMPRHQRENQKEKAKATAKQWLAESSLIFEQIQKKCQAVHGRFFETGDTLNPNRFSVAAIP